MLGRAGTLGTQSLYTLFIQTTTPPIEVNDTLPKHILQTCYCVCICKSDTDTQEVGFSKESMPPPFFSW